MVWNKAADTIGRSDVRCRGWPALRQATRG
jgi:hypothetical protein